MKEQTKEQRLHPCDLPTKEQQLKQGICNDCKYYKKECNGCTHRCEHPHKQGCLNYYCAFRLIIKKIKGDERK